MSEKKQFVCSECGRCYKNNTNLRKHVAKAHSEKLNDIAPRIRTQNLYAYQCEICKKNFSYQYNFKRHQRDYHGEVSAGKKTLKCKKTFKCSLCNHEAAKQNSLYEHFEFVHGILVKSEVLQFSSFDEFKKWKENIEEATKSRFVKNRGSRVACDNTTRHYYSCHRSGNFVSKSKGVRHLKWQGTNKISAVCPAKIYVNEDENGMCNVTFMSTHVGHQLGLTAKESSGIATDIVRTTGKLTKKKNILNRHKSSMEINEELIIKEDNSWKVPSTSKVAELYFVQENDVQCNCKLKYNDCKSCIHKYSCSCVDSSIKRNMCMHILTDEFVIDSEDACTVSETEEISAKVSKKETPNDSMSVLRERELIASEFLDLIKGISTKKELEILKKHSASFKEALTAVRNESEKVPMLRTKEVSLQRKIVS